MTTTPLPTLLTLDDWFALDHPDETSKAELVRGLVAMSPYEAPINRVAVAELAPLLTPTLTHHLLPLQDLALALTEAPATARIPDLVVADETIADRPRVWGSDVELVVEVVSPSSILTDWVHKRSEYAAAGVPAYLVIDVQSETPRIALFDHVEGEDYADPVGDGRSVVLHLGGRDIPVALDDLRP